MSKLTVNERQAKLEQVAAIDPVVLAKTPVSELRKLASGLVTGYSGLKRQDLLDSISDAVSATRERQLMDQHEKALEALAKTEAPDAEALRTAHKAMYVPVSMKEKAKSIMRDLDRVLQMTGTLEDKKRKITAIAYKFMTEQRDRYQPTTMKGNLTELKKELIQSLGVEEESTAYKDLRFVTLYFVSSVFGMFSETSVAIKRKHHLDVALGSKKLKPVDSVAMVTKAVGVLENIAKASLWEVVLSVILLTGRRPSEIMTTGTRFEAKSKDTLSFLGQLKGKCQHDIRDVAFDIPVLADTTLIMKGWEYIQASGKQLVNPDNVNQKYATPMRRALANYGWVDFSPGLVVYDLRRIYACTVLLNRPVGITANAYIGKVLGHSPSDIATANSYQTFYIQPSPVSVFV